MDHQFGQMHFFQSQKGNILSLAVSLGSGQWLLKLLEKFRQSTIFQREDSLKRKDSSSKVELPGPDRSNSLKKTPSKSMKRSSVGENNEVHELNARNASISRLSSAEYIEDYQLGENLHYF